MRTVTMSPTQVKILHALNKGNPLSRSELEQAVGTTIGTETIGPIYAEDIYNHPDSLCGMGYVTPYNDEDGLRWYITAEGAKVASRMRTRKATSAVVPGDILDPVVIAFRPTRTYGIELYTEDDIKVVRSRLPHIYSGVSLDDLRQQIVNRRKMGKYKTVVSVPEWYIIYRQGQHWTALVEEMTEHNGCVINPAHKDNVSVYHRRWYRGGESVINQETPKDLVILCEHCRKKLAGNLPEVPDKMPQTT